MLSLWYFDWRQRDAQVEDSWWREAERLAAVYEAHAQNARTGKPTLGDPPAQNHQEMAQLLASGRPGRRTSDNKQPWYSKQMMLLVFVGGAGVLALVSGVSGFWARRSATRPEVESGPSGSASTVPPPVGQSSRFAEPGAAADGGGR